MLKGIKISNWVLPALVILPLAGIVLLTVGVLLPTLNDPESRVYSSDIGYPARQRKAGKPISVETFVVGQGPLENTIGAPGVSVALDNANIRPAINGVIEQVFVKEGDWVQKGQKLFRLRETELQTRVQQAEAELSRSQAQLRQLELEAQGAAELLESEVDLAVERFDEADQRLQENETYVRRQIQRDAEAARIRLDNTRERLERTRRLYEDGAVSEFQLFDAEDIYAERLQDFEEATEGVFFDQNHRFINRDFFLEREQDLITAQQQLATLRRTKAVELQSLRLEVEKASASLAEARAMLDKTTLYAVTAGLISQLNVDAGDFYEIGEESLITLSRNVAFETFVDQIRLDTVQIGDPAIVRLVAYPGQTFEGEVIRINPAVETEGFRLGKVSINRQYTYSVWVKVKSLQMPPGLQGFATLNPIKERAIRIPESAVTHLSGGEGMVMVVADGQAAVRQVGLGHRFDNTREVVSGLDLGEQVILNPRVLQPGDRVEPNPVEFEMTGPNTGPNTGPKTSPKTGPKISP
ncbi:MAG: efflux RND transporter periplasmic adaptor subunit [Cyanobacteria bacterium P01_A01_bin.114]